MKPTVTTDVDVLQFTTDKPSLALQAPGAVEVLRFESDGRVYVRGELVDTNAEVYQAFLGWLREVGAVK